MTAFVAPAPSRPAAMVLMLCASAMVGLTMLLAKALGTDALGPPLHPLQITQGRFMFALFVVGLAFAALRPRRTAIHWPMHGGRVLFGVVGVTLMFAAAARLPLSDATAITFLNPVFAMLLAIPLLGERVGPIRWFAAGIAFLGMLVLLRPGTEAMQPAALLALGAAMAFGVELMFLKRLSGREGPLQVLGINNLLGLAVASLLVIPVWITPTWPQLAALVALGTAMAGAQTLYINALARAEASFVVPFSYLVLVFATLYDALIFGVVPGALSFLGAGIILAGGLLLAWREGRRAA